MRLGMQIVPYDVCNRFSIALSVLHLVLLSHYVSIQGPMFEPVHELLQGICDRSFQFRRILVGQVLLDVDVTLLFSFLF